MPSFEHEQTFSCSVESLFNFLTRPANMIRLSPPDSGLVFHSAPEVIQAGVELEFEVQAYGQSQSIVHEIVEVERPRRILERMVHGPFEDLEHEHLFDGDESESKLVDRITFTPPRGLLGLLLTEARVVSSLQKSFDYRRRELEALIAQGELE